MPKQLEQRFLCKGKAGIDRISRVVRNMHFEQMVSKEPAIKSLTGESTRLGLLLKPLRFTYNVCNTNLCLSL